MNQRFAPPHTPDPSALPGWYPDPWHEARLRYYDGVNWTATSDLQPDPLPAASVTHSSKVKAVLIAFGIAALIGTGVATNQIHFHSASASSSNANDIFRDRIVDDLPVPVGIFECQQTCVQDRGGNPYLPSALKPGGSFLIDTYIFSQSRIGVETAAGVWIGCLYVPNLTTGVTLTVDVSSLFSATQQACTYVQPPARVFRGSGSQSALHRA